MKQSATIKKYTNSQDDLDYDFLRKEGLAYIEKIGSDLWTDYNSHDPGITILEMLAYAITDLGQRIELPIESLLASKENNLREMHKQFLSAVNILPGKPVTALDYRDLFVHIKGIKNAWIKAHDRSVHINCDEHPAQLSYNPFKNTEKKHDPFKIKGLNDIIIDLEDGVKNAPAIIEKVKRAYHKNRNFCEDLVDITVVEEHPIAVCAYIDLEPNANEELILAQIHLAIDNYFSPVINFYSLEEMFGKGYTSDEIFQGPIILENACVDLKDVKGGFTDKSELEQADLRKEIRLSDIIQLIMDIEGVKVIKDISIGHCGEDLGLKGSWNLCVDPWHKPVRCSKSTFNFTKGLLPIGVNTSRVKQYEEELKNELKEKRQAVVTEDLEMPLGAHRETDAYTTIQNDFPDTYGITKIGIPGKVTTERSAKANQLKAYLLFFDQILANYFKHLSKAKDLLSVDEALRKLYLENAVLTEGQKMRAQQTFFSQKVEDLKGIETLLTSYPDYEEDLITIMNGVKEVNKIDLIDIGGANIEEATKNAIFYERRNMLLDHLIARFAERFADYVFVMKTIYGDNEQTNDDILRAKLGFLTDYKQLSCERGSAFNYCHPKVYASDDGIWDTMNVAGVQKRIARLLGIRDYSRRDLCSEHLEVYDEKDKVDDGMVEYRWRIKDGTKILLSSSKHYHNLGDAYAELFLSYHLAKNPDNYDFKKTKTGNRTYFNLINPEITDVEDEDRIVARRIAYTTSKEASEKARDQLIEVIRDLSVDEGMYMIEHILLRPDTMNQKQFTSNRKYNPDAAPEDFMPSCLDRDCKSCSPVDPYSFRVTVILPGWTHRFGNKDFRNFAEQLIREEMPSHILAKICWVGHPKDLVPDSENDMLNIQEKYQEFLSEIQCSNVIDSKEKLLKRRKIVNQLVTCLGKANTIYHSGRLHDCDNEDTEESGTKIVLGRTNIGNLN